MYLLLPFLHNATGDMVQFCMQLITVLDFRRFELSVKFIENFPFIHPVIHIIKCCMLYTC